MKLKTDEMKEILIKGMLENFKKDGMLVPTIAVLKKGAPVITVIPPYMLENDDAKSAFCRSVKKMVASDNEIEAVYLIIEAYAKVVTPKEKELGKLLMNGNLRVSELKEKNDVIVMVYSTPTEEAMISYIVDPKKKSVLEKLPESGESRGIMSHFFELRK